MTKKKKILFIHQNFPAQYKHIYKALIDEGHEVHSLSIKEYIDTNMVNHHYKLSSLSSENINEWAVEFESKMIRAESAAKKALEIKESGFYPDLIIGHPGWGETFFLKEVWPEVKLLSYVEFYYKTSNCDVDFDKEFVESVLKRDFDKFYNYTKFKLAARNAPFLASYSTSDFLVCPTEYQKNLVPEPIRSKIDVIHDGIDTEVLKPKDDVTVTINGRQFSKKDNIVTYISRSLDPYRGFHIFMRSLPEVLKNNPEANIFIVGGQDTHGYGAPLKDGNFKDYFLNEIRGQVDTDKIFFLDFLEYSSYLRVIQISSVHIYLTYPFVLSWSLLEAMSCEAIIIGSKTEPVTEVLTDNDTGLLIDFFDSDQLSKMITKVLKNKDNYIKIKKNARKKILKDYDLKKVCLPAHLKLINKALK